MWLLYGLYLLATPQPSTGLYEPRHRAPDFFSNKRHKGMKSLERYLQSDSINARARDWARALSSPLSIGLLSSSITSAKRCQIKW
jgi:hypothetical protein